MGKKLAVVYPGGEEGLELAVMASFERGLLKHHPYNSTDDRRFRPLFATFIRRTDV